VTLSSAGSKQYPLVTLNSNPCTNAKLRVYRSAGGTDTDITASLKKVNGDTFDGSTTSFWDIPSGLQMNTVTPDIYVYWQDFTQKTTFGLPSFASPRWNTNGRKYNAFFKFQCKYGPSTATLFTSVTRVFDNNHADPEIMVSGSSTSATAPCSPGGTLVVMKSSTGAEGSFTDITTTVTLDSKFTFTDN
jgi:hypothetical protein